MNIKKVGLTALAGSLVATSAFAGAVSVAGGASMGVKNNSGTDGGKSWTMGNQLTFTGGGELDNGLNVAISFVLDQGDADPSPFDGHSVSVSSDTFGTLKLDGEGGSSAASAMDTSAAGDIWDTFDGSRGTATAVAVSDTAPGDNSIMYTLPSMMDGLSVFASLNPQESAVNETETGYGVTYSGIEGLSVSYATTDIESGVTATSGDHTALKATYAYGPVTVGYSKSDHDTGKVGISACDHRTSRRV